MKAKKVNSFSKEEFLENPEKIYNSNNSGGFTVIDCADLSNINIKFVETSGLSKVTAGNIRSGEIKDNLAASVFALGYIGNGEHKAKVNGRDVPSYVTWVSILRRCYSEIFHIKNPTYKDCSVCPEWLNYQTFAEWFNKNHIDGLHIDKDIKIKGNKIYSPDACTFVSQTDNSIESNAKHYKFTSPDGEIVEIYNMAEFCRENKLQNSAMSLVYQGKQSHHHGWRLDNRLMLGSE